MDGLYQSLMCFYMGYLLFAPADFPSSNGLGVNDRERMGMYIAHASVIVVNVYILLKSYRWDWLILTLVSFSILLIFFWSGVWSAFLTAALFYQAAPQVFGQLSFWLLTLLAVVVCLLPRFLVKSFQKLFMPYDVDIIREQVRLGHFKSLDDIPAHASGFKLSSAASSDLAKASPHQNGKPSYPLEDDERPIYPPSVTHTTTTHNRGSHNGSDETNYNGRYSADLPSRPMSTIEPASRPLSQTISRMSMDRPRPSFDRIRSSMDRVRPSFEASNDFTSAALLTRVESSHSDIPTRRRCGPGSSNLR